MIWYGIINSDEELLMHVSDYGSIYAPVKDQDTYNAPKWKTTEKAAADAQALLLSTEDDPHRAVILLSPSIPPSTRDS